MTTTELSPFFVRTMGDGPRRLLALHCTMAHSGVWIGLNSCLRDQVTLIAPDMPSHGKSADWDGQSDFFDVTTKLAATQLTEPTDIIGHSFGAMVALRLAVEHPDMIRSVTLIEPVFFAIAAQDAPDLLARHDKEAQPYVDALKAANMPLAARLFNRMWSAGISPPWDDLMEKTRDAMARGVTVVPGVADALFQDTKGLLKPEALSRATMPVLLLAGSKTHPVMPAIGQGLQRRLPNATFATVEGAGHMLPISHPRETAAHLTELWRTPAPSSV